MVANTCLLKVVHAHMISDQVVGTNWITNIDQPTGLVHPFLCPSLLRAACHQDHYPALFTSQHLHPNKGPKIETSINIMNQGTMDLSWSESFQKNWYPKIQWLVRLSRWESTKFLGIIVWSISLDTSHDPTCSSHHGLNVVVFHRYDLCQLQWQHCMALHGIWDLHSLSAIPVAQGGDMGCDVRSNAFWGDNFSEISTWSM